MRELNGISAPSPQQQKLFNSATRIGVSAVGVLCGLAGLEHGVGEILQGNYFNHKLKWNKKLG